MENDIRTVIQFAHCLEYRKFCTLFHIAEDGFYSKEKYKKMQSDFGRWYCGLDSANAERLTTAAFPWRKTRVVESGEICHNCGDSQPVMYFVCGDCKK